MIEIREKQILEIKNLFSFRGKVIQNEIEGIGKNMEQIITRSGAKRIGAPISATYSIEGNLMDLEILIPIDKTIDEIEKYSFKEKLLINNAVVAVHKGNPNLIQSTFNALNEYITKNNLQPITVGYNVTKKIDLLNQDNTEIEIYVGVNSNIL